MGAAQINGTAPASITQESFEYTSTRSTFIMNVNGQVSMNVTFLSPVNPADLQRQSIIGSYLYVNVASIDGGSHSVQLYADTSAGMYPNLHLEIAADVSRMGQPHAQHSASAMGVSYKCLSIFRRS